MQLAVLLLLGSSLAATEGVGAASADSAYRRVVDKALRRAHTDLVGSLDLWEDHSSWEDPWEVATEHFTVRSTHSRYLAQDLARGLEAMLEHFQYVLGTDHAPPRPRAVWVLPDLQAYNEYGNANGAEHSSIYGSFYSAQDAERPVATYYTSNSTLLRMWATHGALHQFVEGAFGTTPPTWILEGLASYFTLYWDWSYGAAEHRRLAADYLPLERLAGETLREFTADPHTRLIQLGMFFNYLLHYREDTLLTPDDPGPFATWLRAVLRGESTRGSEFQELLREPDALLEDFRAFDFSG